MTRPRPRLRRRPRLDLALSLGLALPFTAAAQAQEPPPIERPTNPSVDPEGFQDSRPGGVSELLDPQPPVVPGDPSSLSSVAPSVFAEARSISDPSERSLALQRAGAAAVFSGQLDEARDALYEAGRVAMQIPEPLRRDQRILGSINALLGLSEESLRAARANEPLFADEAPPEPLGPDRIAYYEAALERWQFSFVLARSIRNPTYRAEAMYRVVERQAFGSQTIINEAYPARVGQPAAEISPTVRAVASRAILGAAREALAIERAVWRNLALEAICSNAAASRQFDEGLTIARSIPQPDIRAEALARLAEAEVLYGNPERATGTYAEAARAAASIPAEGVRAVIAGVLIDNLISVGRFDDARACVTLYPDITERVTALGAVAESMGRRGLGESAYRWIDAEVGPEFRPVLQRRVIDGVLASVQQNRSRDLVGGRGGLR